MRSTLIPVSLIGSLALGPAVTATETGEKKTSVPGHMMPMDKVRDSFGAPESVLDAVGDPPIARWVYSGYTVYFEHELTLTSVRHRAP